MKVREYRESDCAEIYSLFIDTIYTINKADYNQNQLDAWASAIKEPKDMHRHFLDTICLVAIDEGIVVGFSNLTSDCLIDYLFVHKDYQGQGVASTLCDALEKQCEGVPHTYASLSAKPFFEKRGYRVIQMQIAKRSDVNLINFHMQKG